MLHMQAEGLASQMDIALIALFTRGLTRSIDSHFAALVNLSLDSCCHKEQAVLKRASVGRHLFDRGAGARAYNLAGFDERLVLHVHRCPLPLYSGL